MYIRECTHVCTCTQYVTGCLISLVLIIPDTVEPQHLLVVVQELPEGVQFLIWSQGLHGFQHLKLEMETRVHAKCIDTCIDSSK